MNKVCLIGRLTAKPELRYASSNIAYSRFILAVNRPKKENGTQDTDFISCVAWKNTADTICKYLNKGSLVGLEGRIQTGSYDREDGTKVYTTDMLVSRIHFLESKGEKRPEPEEPTEIERDPFADFGEQVTIDDNFLD